MWFTKQLQNNKKRRNIMSTLELLQLQNEHNDNFFGKGEDATEEQEGE